MSDDWLSSGPNPMSLDPGAVSPALIKTNGKELGESIWLP